MNFSSLTIFFRRHLIALLAVVVVSSSLFLVYQSLGIQALETLSERAENRLTLFVSNLEGKLAKFEHLPELIADSELMRLTLEQSPSMDKTQANQYLKQVAKTTGALDIYLMSSDGTTIASSNWDQPFSFVGRNFSFRPYFRQAIAGDAGRYFALGITTLVRGYFFSYPVFFKERVLGVLVVKIKLSDIESAWSEQGSDFIVTDEDDIIFLSTRNEWTYRSLSQLPLSKLKEILESRRYDDREIVSLSIRHSGYKHGEFDLTEIRRDSDGSWQQYLHLKHPMINVGWEVHSYTNTDAASSSQLLRTALAAFGLLVLLLLIGLYVVNRQRRMVLQQSTETLESRVQQRTRELRTEIEERKKAEQSLRETQTELIQAAKMAGLGQMSAGISHELNQPLTAIRNYARNARSLLESDKKEDAKGNLVEIDEITRHMSSIIKQLRGFSRKSIGERKLVSLRESVDQAMGLFHRDIESKSIDCHINVDSSLAAVTDPLLLNQVLVNVIGNAIQAMGLVTTRRITIEGVSDSKAILILISDTGTGIDKNVISNVFDPFFTTKELGIGLGLGLSISYKIMDSLGGQIEAANIPNGGACFTLYLPYD